MFRILFIFILRDVITYLRPTTDAFFSDMIKGNTELEALYQLEGSFTGMV